MAKAILAANIMHAPLGRLEAVCAALEAAGAEEIYFPIQDGRFDGHHTLGPDFVRMARDCCKLPVHAHLMVLEPARHVEAYALAGARTVTVHAETCVHGHRVLSQIRDAGAAPGIAVNPGTALSRLEYLLPHVNRVLLRTGARAANTPKLIANAAERVRILREHLQYSEYAAEIHVEGETQAADAAQYLHFGAQALVLPREVLFAGEPETYAATLERYRHAVTVARNLV